MRLTSLCFIVMIHYTLASEVDLSDCEGEGNAESRRFLRCVKKKTLIPVVVLKEPPRVKVVQAVLPSTDDQIDPGDVERLKDDLDTLGELKSKDEFVLAANKKLPIKDPFNEDNQKMESYAGKAYLHGGEDDAATIIAKSKNRQASNSKEKRKSKSSSTSTKEAQVALSHSPKDFIQIAVLCLFFLFVAASFFYCLSCTKENRSGFELLHDGAP